MATETPLWHQAMLPEGLQRPRVQNEDTWGQAGASRAPFPMGTLGPGLQGFQLTTSLREVPLGHKEKSPPQPPDLPAHSDRRAAWPGGDGRWEVGWDLADTPKVVKGVCILCKKWGDALWGLE